MRFDRWLAAALTALLCMNLLLCPAAAYSADEIVGSSGMALTSGEETKFSGESTLGSACADAVRLAASADFALVCSGDLNSSLSPGDITWEEIRAVFTDADCSIVRAQVTVPQLVELLEYGLSSIVLDGTEMIDRSASAFEGFPQISGFQLTYDASAKAGERVMRINVDGQSLDLSDTERTYTLAVPESLFDYGYPTLETADSGISLAQALAAYAASGIPATYTDNSRITAAGSRDSSVFSQIPAYVFVVLAMLGIAFCVWRSRRLDRDEFDEK